MRGSCGIPWDIPGRIDNALGVECGKAAVVRDRIVLFVWVFYQLKGACPTDTNCTHQSPQNTDPAYIAATEQFRTVAHGWEVRLPALVAQIL